MKHLVERVGVLVVALALTYRHVSDSGILQRHGNVREIKADEAYALYEVGNALYRLVKHVIYRLERVSHAELCVGYLLDSLVRDNDEGVNVLSHLCNALESLVHLSLTFKRERLGDNANSQLAHFLRDGSNYRSRARTGAAAHSGSDKHHGLALHYVLEIVAVLLRRILTYRRVIASALTSGALLADLNTAHSASVFGAERLDISVGNNVVNSGHIPLDHVADCVSAAAADADDHYFGLVLEIVVHHELIIVCIYFKCHVFFPPNF